MSARAAGVCVVALVLSAPLLAAQRAAAVPHPPLEALEPAVAEQLRQARRDLDASPDAAGAYAALARFYHVYEFFEEAETAYLQAIRRAPGDVQSPHLLGYLYQQTGRLDDAAARFLEARRISAADDAAALRLGEVYLALNRTREARDVFDSVRAQFPALVRHGLGEVALRDGRFDEAIAHF